MLSNWRVILVSEQTLPLYLHYCDRQNGANSSSVSVTCANRNNAGIARGPRMTSLFFNLDGYSRAEYGYRNPYLLKLENLKDLRIYIVSQPFSKDTDRSKGKEISTLLNSIGTKFLLVCPYIAFSTHYQLTLPCLSYPSVTTSTSISRPNP